MKIQRTESIYLDEETFESVINSMTKFKELHPEGTDFKFDYSSELENLYTYLVCYEEETEEEKLCRETEEKRIQAIRDESDKKEFERLQAKFKNK